MRDYKKELAEQQRLLFSIFEKVIIAVFSFLLGLLLG
jgi:predicted Co/Zn/Cd cation transporter (cation efflux family)